MDTKFALLMMSLSAAVAVSVASGGPDSGSGNGAPPGGGITPDLTSQAIAINSVEFKVNERFRFFTWDSLPADVNVERQEVKAFTAPDGETHYYEAVYVPSENLNWYQAAKLAEDAGGYLACPTSEAENNFVFSLVSDEKFFWRFPKSNGNARMEHYEIMIGPWLGGYQPLGAAEPAGEWSWLSGEKWEWNNWAANLDDGVIDKDPRPSGQPNNVGNSPLGQRIMGYSEMNVPVPTWGDYMDNTGAYGMGRTPGKSHGFVIEYDRKPL